jgi:hypothetical protein
MCNRKEKFKCLRHERSLMNLNAFNMVKNLIRMRVPRSHFIQFLGFKQWKELLWSEPYVLNIHVLRTVFGSCAFWELFRS